MKKIDPMSANINMTTNPIKKLFANEEPRVEKKVKYNYNRVLKIKRNNEQRNKHYETYDSDDGCSDENCLRISCFRPYKKV